MRKSRFSTEQIAGILKESDAGLGTDELSRKYGISGTTVYNWKAKYGGMSSSDAKKLKHLALENQRLKHLVADQALDNRVLKELLSKNF